MSIFKNKVGRPSNETIRKRKIIKYSIFIGLIAVISLVTYSLTKLPSKKLSGNASIENLGYQVFDEEGDFWVDGIAKSNDKYMLIVTKNIGDNSESINVLKELDENFEFTGNEVEFEVTENGIEHDSVSWIDGDVEICSYAEADSDEEYFYIYDMDDGKIIIRVVDKKLQFVKTIEIINPYREFEHSGIYKISDDKYILYGRNYDNNWNSYKCFIIFGEEGNIISTVELEKEILPEQGFEEVIDIESSFTSDGEYIYNICGFYDGSKDRYFIIKYDLDGQMLNINEIEFNLEDMFDFEISENFDFYLGIHASDSKFSVSDGKINFIGEYYYEESGDNSSDYSSDRFGSEGIISFTLNENGEILENTVYPLKDLISESYDDIGFEYLFITDDKIFIPFYAESEDIDDEVQGLVVLGLSKSYKINIIQNDGGELTSSIGNEKKKPGTLVPFEVNFDDGYELDYIKIYDDNNNDITKNISLDFDEMTFKMPSSDIIVKPFYKKKTTTISSSGDNTTSSTSVASSDNNTTYTTLTKFNPSTLDDIKKYVFVGISGVLVLVLAGLYIVKGNKK